MKSVAIKMIEQDKTKIILKNFGINLFYFFYANFFKEIPIAFDIIIKGFKYVCHLNSQLFLICFHGTIAFSIATE